MHENSLFTDYLHCLKYTVTPPPPPLQPPHHPKLSSADTRTGSQIAMIRKPSLGSLNPVRLYFLFVSKYRSVHNPLYLLHCTHIFLFSLTLLSLFLSLPVCRPVELTDGRKGRGEGEGAKSLKRRESWSSIIHKLLSGVHYTEPSFGFSNYP
jgi:hypothetical protein